MRTYALNYTCPQCGSQAKIGGGTNSNIQPMSCPGCGKIICKKCHIHHFCPDCQIYLTKKQKKWIDKKSKSINGLLIIMWNLILPVVPILLLFGLSKISEAMHALVTLISFGLCLMYLPILCVLAGNLKEQRKKLEKLLHRVGNKVIEQREENT